MAERTNNRLLSGFHAKYLFQRMYDVDRVTLLVRDGINIFMNLRCFVQHGPVLAVPYSGSLMFEIAGGKMAYLTGMGAAHQIMEPLVD